MQFSRFFFRKSIGFVCILAAIVIFLYLGWFYFVMPRLVINEKDSLEMAFGGGTSYNTYDDYAYTLRQQPEKSGGVIIGGILYPDEYTPETSNAGSLVTSRPSSGQPRTKAYLSVPELNIREAHVEFNVDGTNERIYDNVLTRAVAHFGGTAYPGEKGNFFLFGHSKIPLLAGTDYESVFTNLPRLKNGAVIAVREDDTIYKYRVNYTAVLSPEDVFILNQPKEERLITLMTCIPPGFGSRRYVAVGNLIEVSVAS